MIIKSIELTNFQCYSGTHNLFEFKEGLNVIIGDNASGKSKLYDAFNWVLYDECFETETRKFKRTPELRGSLISDMAKYDTPIGYSVKTEVVLTFYRQTLKKEEEEFTVKRSYEIVRKSEQDWNQPDNSKIEIYKRNLPLRPQHIDESPQEFIGKVLMPNNIRKYTWFQGEQVDSLIDFENRKALTDAINILSNISLYDECVNFADKLADSSEKEYQGEAKRLGKDEGRFNSLQQEKKEKEQKLLKLKEEEVEASNNFSHARIQVNKLIGLVGDATEISKLQERANNIEKSIDRREQELQKKQAQINKLLFTQSWVLRNVGHLFEEYEKKFDKYETTRAQREAERNVAVALETRIEQAFKERLPKGNPEPMHLKRMLKEEHCLVCDREAKEGSDAWLKIKDLLDQTLPNRNQANEPITAHNFSSSFKILYQSGLRLQNNIQGIDCGIQTEMLQIQNYYDDIKELKTQWKEVDDKLQILLMSSGSTLNNASTIKKDFEEFTKKSNEFSSLKTRLNNQIQSIEKDLIYIKNDIKDLTRGKMPKALEEKRNILADFKLIAKSTRDRVFHNLIEQLELEANEHFLDMTKGNLGTKGRIKLVKRGDDYIPKNVDANGVELTNINDSDIILVKVAVILAIISAKESSRATDLYTLITDAPSSKFTDNYTIGFCQRVGMVYNQSIIMSKDFHLNETLKSRLLEGEVKNLGHVYRITPSVIEEHRTDRNTLSTKIQKIK
jgi:DNA sulfur modification protein DndD